MCSSDSFEEWQHRCILELTQIREVELSLLIVDGGSADIQAPALQKRLLNFLQAPCREKKDKLLRFLKKKRIWRFYSEYYLLRKSKARQKTGLSALFEQTPKIICKTFKKGRCSQFFLDADIAEIKRYDLDLILRFGFSIIKGDILTVATFGIWSFHHDDETKYRGGPPGFWEIFFNDPVTGAILQQLTDRLDGGVILYKGYFKTRASYVNNIDTTYFCSAQWPASICRRLLLGQDMKDFVTPSQTQAPIYFAPTDIQMIVFFLKKSIVAWKTKVSSFFLEKRDIWNIGIANAPIGDFLNHDNRPDITWLPHHSDDVFLADPFVIMHKNKIVILAERYSYSHMRGVIVYLEQDDQKNFTLPRTALDLKTHASYPYLLREKNEIYCVPETYSAREIGLYKAKVFPAVWEKERTIINDIPAGDSTLFRYAGYWWLFYMLQDEYRSSESLYIQYADELMGAWCPHPLNPVKTDISSARPAGTPFVYCDQLYRPAQDCSKAYGGRIVFNRIDELTPTSFREEIAFSLEPKSNSPYPHGIHTISHAGDITVIDGKREINILKSIPRGLRQRGN